MKNKLKEGAKVKCLYKKPWKGIVVLVKTRGKTSPLATVAVTHDKNGVELRKPYLTDIDTLLLEVV